jgi:hypothetical protein
MGAPRGRKARLTVFDHRAYVLPGHGSEAAHSRLTCVRRVRLHDALLFPRVRRPPNPQGARIRRSGRRCAFAASRSRRGSCSCVASPRRRRRSGVGGGRRALGRCMLPREPLQRRVRVCTSVGYPACSGILPVAASTSARSRSAADGIFRKHNTPCDRAAVEARAEHSPLRFASTFPRAFLAPHLISLIAC